MEQEISLLEVWSFFRKYFVRIVGATIIAGAISVIFMMFFVDRQYESEAQLLVNQSNGTDLPVQYNEVQTNINLVNTYRDIIQGNAVLGQVNENLGNVFTITELREAISIEQSQDSQAFYISAVLDSPTDAQNVVNNIVSEFENTLREVYEENVSSVYVMSTASYNPNPVSPSLILFALGGGILGFITMIIIALVRELGDNRVKSASDLTDMGMIRLAEIHELTPAQVKKNRFRIESDKQPLRRRV